MSYRVSWPEFSAALALVDQEHRVGVVFTSLWVTFEGYPPSRDRVRTLLRMFKIRRFLDIGDNHYIISVSRDRFEGLPEG